MIDMSAVVCFLPVSPKIPVCIHFVKYDLYFSSVLIPSTTKLFHYFVICILDYNYYSEIIQLVITNIALF